METSDYLKLGSALHLWRDISAGLPNKQEAKTASNEMEGKPTLKIPCFKDCSVV